MTEIAFTVPVSPYFFYWFLGWLCFIPSLALAQFLAKTAGSVAKSIRNTRKK